MTASRHCGSTAWSVSTIDTPPIAQLTLHDANGINHGVARTSHEVYVWRTPRTTGQVRVRKMELPFVGRGRRLMPVEVCASGCVAVEVADESMMDEPIRMGLRRFFSPGAGGSRKGKGRAMW